MKQLIPTILVLFLLVPVMGVAQPKAEAALAEQYFKDGEFQAAYELYDKLYREDPREQYAMRLSACQEGLQQYDEAIKTLDRHMRRGRNYSPQVPLTKALVMERTGDLAGADALYQQVITEELRDEGDFIMAGAFLYQKGKLDLARKTYEQARERLRNPYLFANEIGNIYAQSGEFENATKEYLNLYYLSSDNFSTVNLSVLNLVSPSTGTPVERALLQAVDRNSSDPNLRVLLYEFYLLSEDFDEAFLQVKSIDRLFREDGERVFEFARKMRNNENFPLSNEAFDYIIERKKDSRYFFLAHLEKAVNGETQAFKSIPVDMVSVRQAVVGYGELLDEFGRRPQYFDAIYRRTRLMVFYLNDLDDARAELESAVRQRDLLRLEDWARGKLLIGDIQLMQQEYNKSKLTYTEVSDAFRDRDLGALAKFKLAQLAYYKGEFNLATALLDAIKDNTSTDISNDAIKLNLLLIDNTGLDTTTVPLEIFAQAQLLHYQRQYSRSLELMDSLSYQFPNHSLADEILWEKANIFLEQNDIPTALTFIDRILENFPTDIFGDDALVTKARIYDYTLKQPEQAMELYLTFLTTYPGSLYSVEVRKRIRALREKS
ncbi:MAG: tetratricopeptide repeat protein [Bacteroidia bacterium]|nr:tetratricopeptide repeat protein [Bacteroidia bacterium]